ncbi:5'-nucleotidase isoform X2 [Echeneis naucrates]|uniref:5'-nucleotidase isoform X2 n=1 Tax=Echeneis naucrates TaxID=173247 RepID=UPI001113928E|nr:5'-nucleotidase-like isoform X2 [Echeneis naucrates]
MGALRPERSAAPRLCLLLLPLLLLLLLDLPGSGSAAWDLVLLHTNDVHGRVEETAERQVKCGRSGSCFGGAARRSTVIQKIRESESNVLLLDAGDQFQGTVWFNYYSGAEAAHFMNKLGYDAMALGNHEFDNGVDGLMKPFLEQIRCPVLSANIKPDQTLAPTFGLAYKPFEILKVGEQKVGIVGYTTQETPALSRPGPHLRFEDEVDAMQPHVDKLKTLGVNKVIALGHSGFTMDKQIAKRLRGVDVVIGGHTNTFLYTGPAPSSEVPAGPYPFVVQSDDGRQVPVVQAFAFGKYLGYLKVTFDDDGNVVRSTGNPILLNSSIPQDPDVLADVEKWKKNLANYSSQVVGETLVLLNGETEECRFRECNLGNLICDAMVANNIRFPDGVQWNHVSACILNGGGIRTSIDEHTRNGFQVEFDVSKPPGHRVKSLRILCTKCRVPTYEAVQDEEVYKVVLPSYLVIGGDGFSMIQKEMLKHYSGDLDISVVAKYITHRGKIYPPVEGRVSFSSSAPGLQGRSAAVAFLSLGLIWTLIGSA